MIEKKQPFGIKSKNVMRGKNLLKIFLLGLLIVSLSSCLTVEKKIYTYELNADNSGKLIIKYVNIYSIMDDGQDVSTNDFNELVDKYINGDQLIQDFPAANKISKKLFEENGQLCGEVTIEFNDLNSARLYQYDQNCPIMMNISTAFDSETYLNSNGEYGNDHMPVVFWPKSSKKLVVTTSVSTPDETSVSLVDAFRNWKSK